MKRVVDLRCLFPRQAARLEHCSDFVDARARKLGVGPVPRSQRLKRATVTPFGRTGAADYEKQFVERVSEVVMAKIVIPRPENACDVGKPPGILNCHRHT
jgi:hypothetical protein